MVTLHVNGVAKTSALATASLRVEKHYGIETCDFLFMSDDGSEEPSPNDEVVVYHDADLLFGGISMAVSQRQWIDKIGLAVRVEARDFSVLLDRIVVSLTIAEGTGAYAAMYPLFQLYLQPKGFTWIAATTGGPALATDLVFDHQTLSSVFNEIATQAEGWWRVNGVKQVALVFAGELVGAPLVDDDVLESDIFNDDDIEDTVAVQVNRLFVRTGGSGTVQHTEPRVGDGVQTRFHLNVEPRAPQDDPPVSYAPTLVTENGTPHTIGGGRWAYDAAWHAVYIVSGLAPSVGHTIIIGPYDVEYPAWVRVWTADATHADGTWNMPILTDGIIQATEKTDIVQTVEWGRIVLARRADAAKTIRLSTYKPGYYPILKVYIDRPERGIEADYLVASVSATGVDLGDSGDDVLYQMELVEGGRLGPTFRDAWLERSGNTAGGTSVLGGSVPSTTPPVGGVTGVLPTGTTFHLGGSNNQSFDATTTWSDVPEAIPTQFGGAGMAGTWTLRVPVYQIGAGTVEVRLLNQTGVASLGSVSTTATGSYVDVSFFDFKTQAITAPASVVDVILQVRVTSGSRPVVVGHSTLVKA